MPEYRNFVGIGQGRSSQYAIQTYQELLKQYGMISREPHKEDCRDNTFVEHFFSNLKQEWTDNQNYCTRERAIADVRDYIVMYSNSEWLMWSMLGYKTPMKFENILNNYCCPVN